MAKKKTLQLSQISLSISCNRHYKIPTKKNQIFTKWAFPKVSKISNRSEDFYSVTRRTRGKALSTLSQSHEETIKIKALVLFSF
jgi:hypothetical protein